MCLVPTVLSLARVFPKLQAYVPTDPPSFVQPNAFGVQDYVFAEGRARHRALKANRTEICAKKPWFIDVGQGGAGLNIWHPARAEYTTPLGQCAQPDPQQQPQIALQNDAKLISLAAQRRADADAFGGLHYV